MQARVPVETGLSPHVAALVAAAAAALRLAGEGAAPEDVARLAEQALRGDGEAGAVDALAVWAAIRGGCQRRIGAQVRSLAIDPAWVEQSLLLVDLGVAAREPAGAPEPSPVDAALETALHARDDGALPRLIAAGWEAACARDPGVVTPEADEVLRWVLAAGGAGRPCGPGGGGLLLLWLPVDARGALAERLHQAGRRTYPCRVDVLGLDVG